MISADTQGGHFTIVDAGRSDHDQCDTDSCASEVTSTEDPEKEEASQSDMTAHGAQDNPQGAPLTGFEDSANPLNTPEQGTLS